MRKNWASTPSASGSYGRLADEIHLDFAILKILYRLNYLDYYFVYSSAMLSIVLEVHFSLLFSNKADFRVCFVARSGVASLTLMPGHRFFTHNVTTCLDAGPTFMKAQKIMYIQYNLS